MSSYNLTSIATNAANFLGVLDQGEGLSTAQLDQARTTANQLLESWYNDQVLALNIQLAAFTLAAGTYTPASMLQFADNTTPITLPAAWDRALTLGLAIEMAPQYDMTATAELAAAAGKAYANASPPTVGNLAVGQREG